jgi:hypothetical protein
MRAGLDLRLALNPVCVLAENFCMSTHREPPAGSRFSFADSERLLRKSPRGMEFTCAIIAGALAAVVLYDFLLHRWFYFNFHQYYQTTAASRVYDWTLACCEVLVSLWLTGLALNLARGRSRRRDKRLFSPTALRVWGVIFAIIPLAVLASSWREMVHIHLFLWCWTAAAACFVLAARGAPVPEPEESSRPIE